MGTVYCKCRFSPIPIPYWDGTEGTLPSLLDALKHKCS
jgi:hypothetical protein